MICDKCGIELLIGMFPFCKGDSADHGYLTSGIIGDELHDYTAKHGLCWPDGTPRKFYSKTELRRAANEAGLCIAGDTPGKPYKVQWSGRRRDGYEHRS